MASTIELLLDTEGFPARWNCGTGWTELHGWTHVVADISIGTAYFAIPLLIGVFAFRRRDTPFLPIFWFFVAFILTCGVGHFVEATIFWTPWYRLSAACKVVTAIASWATLIAFVPVVPRALALPGLAAVNDSLKAEIRERERTEASLTESNQELQEFTDRVVDREDRMVELKGEVNALLRELGRAERYST